MAKENKQPEQNEALRGILDPIAPEDLTEHWQNISGWLDPMRDLNPEYLANMDYNKQISGGNQSFNQYWDDSSPEMQWTLGWTNQKYTWEYTKNSDINYDANITTKDLNPNFVYWKASQVYGTDHPWYISQRNDQIASALFNEWRVSKEEVQAFLESQNWFFNSSEADRANTVESIWKRLWQLSEQNKPEEEWPDLSKAEEIQKDTSGKIYWKTTAEEWTPKEWINTLADKNSVYAAMEAWRVANLKALVTMNPKDIATAELSWIMPQWEQANRDLQQYYPDIYKQVQEEKKKIIAQENTTALASWWEMTTIADKVDTNTELTSYAVNNSTNSTSATQLLKGIDSILESNDTAKSAQELMWSIEKDMAELKNRLKNLKNEANAAFKWDVPQYLVNAYMNNKAQEIQNQMSILEDRYNAAYTRYKQEVANAQWEKEYELKERQVKIQEDAQSLNEWKTKNWVTWTSSSWTWKATMRTERNNNPTAMTTDVAKMLWGELWVDYEIWDPFTTASWQTLYTAKLIWDPIETTIRLIDRWIANGIDPFYRANWQPRWSYISKIGITKEKWQQMSPAEKADIIAQMLKHEWWSMENMLYYVNQSNENWWWENTDYDMAYQSAYDKYLSWDYSKAWLEAQTKAMWVTEQDFDAQARAWKKDLDEWLLDVEDDILMNWWKWKRNDGKEYDFSKSKIYRTLSAKDKVAVQQLLNNERSLNYINTNRTKYDDPASIQAAVSEIEPLWSETWFKNRQTAENKREQGKQWWWISRNETAMTTAMEIYKMAWKIDDSTWNWLRSKGIDNISALKNLKAEYLKQTWHSNVIELQVALNWLQSEAAGALKWWNAAISDQDKNDMKEIFDMGLSQEQLQAAMVQMGRLLYWKDESEVKDLAEWTFMKPNSTWTEDASDWLYNVVWVDLTKYYNYVPKWWKPPKDSQQSGGSWSLDLGNLFPWT